MDAETIETIELKNVQVNIYLDDNPMNPREWDNLGTMAFYHRHYLLGDKLEFSNPQDLMNFVKKERAVYLPVFAYEHGQISISTGREYPYNDMWDSGQLGIIYILRSKIAREYGWIRLTKNRINKIKSYLKNEVDTYDQFLRGDVYGYTTSCLECGNDLDDSCWGFYGSNWKENGLLDEISDLPDQCPHCKETIEVNSRLDEVCYI